MIYFVDTSIRCLCQLILLAFQFLLFDCWPFDFLRTQCNMHVSLRSNGQSPLWLPTPNHSSRPSSRVSVLFVSVSLYISLALLSVPHCMCSSSFLLFFLWFLCLLMSCVSNMVCTSFIKYFCGVLCRDLCCSGVMWMLYLFSVCRIKLYLFWINIFCCCLWL